MRGAAVLGGIVFALAGLYLFRYSITQGWISPAVRVTLATLAGLGALVGGQKLQQRYRVTSHAISAGGIVVLYAAFWAARALYDLVPFGVSFLLMALTTAVAGVLAVRQHNRLAAYLGLLGGFATPLLLSTGQNAPFALFGYVLLLDLAMLTIAYLRRWSSVAALALGGTLLMQVGWVFKFMNHDQVWVAFAVLALFAALFALFAMRFKPEAGATSSGLSWRVMQAAALLTPAFFLTYFSATTELQVPFLAEAGFLAVLTLGAGFVHRRSAQGESLLIVSAGFAQLVVLLTAAASRPGTEVAGWAFMAANVALALIGLLNVGLTPAGARRTAAAWAAIITAGGIWLLLGLATLRAPVDLPVLPYLAALTALTGALLWLAVDAGLEAWAPVVGAVLAVTFFACRQHGLDERYGEAMGAFAEVSWRVGPQVVWALLLGLWSALWKPSRASALTLAVFASCSVVFNLVEPAGTAQDVVVVLLAQCLLVVVSTVASVQARQPLVTLAGFALLGVHLGLPAHLAVDQLEPSQTLLLVGCVAGVVLQGLMLVAGKSFYAKVPGGFAAGALWPFLFVGLLLHWRASFGLSAQGLFPLLIAAALLGAAAMVRARELSPGRAGMIWLMAAALCFIAVAVPLQLDRQWVTLSWALMGLGHLLLWKRFDHPGLKWLAVALLAAVSVRLLLNPSVLDYSARSPVPIFNWLTYTYLVPAVCLGMGSWVLLGLEVPRARPAEGFLYAQKVPLVSAALSVASALVVFAWVTLSVFDFYGAGSTLTLTLDRLPARDLSLSLAWIVYAGSLLAVGMWRRSRPMRWLSLVFLLVSIGKVFLYDLGELKDLYRVASLMGLSISLIVVSLAYQRFVFRREATNP